MIVLFLNFLRKLYTFFHSCCTNLPCAQGFHFFPSSPTPVIFCLFDNNHASRCDRYKVIPHCGFDLHFSDQQCRASFMYLLALSVFFGEKKNVYQDPLSIFQFYCLRVFVFYFQLYEFLIYLRYQPLIRCMIYIFLIPFSGLYLHVVDGFLLHAEAETDKPAHVCFYFACLCFWCQIQKIIARINNRRLLPMFSSTNFMVSGLFHSGL